MALQSDLLDIVLRKSYGFAFPAPNTKAMMFWHLLAMSALKLEDRELYSQALRNLVVVARGQNDIGKIVKFLRVVERCDEPEVGQCAAELRQHHAVKLLRNEDYRRQLDGNRELMWKHLDDFVDVAERACKE